MDEMATANLGCFFLLPLPSPACTIPSPLALLAMLPSPALIIPFPPVNKLPNKLAPNVPSNIFKNPSLTSIADIAAVKSNGANTFLANGNATFINGPANLLNNLPKNLPDCINFFI